MKIGIVVGTRPEIIKMAPVIRECQKRKIPFFIIHSNQHYSADMDAIFFQELSLPSPHYNLHVGSGLHSNQTGNILIKMEPILLDEQPDLVLVQGDTNTVLAGALAASKLDIKVGHIEAGLRSYDRTMPEETNRVLTDHMSHYLFSVGDSQSTILRSEGIEESKIIQVGNTISDALFQHIPLAEKSSNILETLDVAANEYILVTAHRASNVDVKAHLEELVELVTSIAKKYQRDIVWPMHPRTKNKLEQYGISLADNIKLSAPLGYLDFIKLQKYALIILTDSGGIQEEACMLHVPCITLRENTERPETVEIGANVLVGRDTAKAIEAIDNWLANPIYEWNNPFGEGNVASLILDHVTPKERAAIQNTANYSNTPSSWPSVTVVGQGYMGLPLACLIAQNEFSVTGVDLNAEKVQIINDGQCPFEEAGLPELITEVIDRGTYNATTDIPCSDFYVIAVPTPHKDKKCDLSYVMSAIDGIGKIAKDGQIVIIESTIPPGTCFAAQSRLTQLGLDIEVVHCPERAIPGHTLHELVNNDRIIGAPSQTSFDKVKKLYESFVRGEIFQTDAITAECVKLVENTSRDIGIAFANELAEICDELRVGVKDVITLANRHPRVNILNPGPGVGGHCIPIDPWFLVENTKSGNLVRHARQINDGRPHKIAEMVKVELAKIDGANVGLLGVAYKPNVDDCRETPAEPILQTLQQGGINVRYHDPHVSKWLCERIDSLDEISNWADVLIVITEHDVYKGLDLPTRTLNNFGHPVIS